MRKFLFVIAGAALFCCGAAVGAAAASPDTTTPGAVVGQAGASAADEAAPAVKPPAKPASKPLAAGTWQVGTEVKPGTYATTADGGCYWARLKGFDGELTSIIANGNLEDGQHGRLTVKASDKGLELTGDCVWTRA